MLNADWHKAHPMPPRATERQRVEWHLAHSAACRCREVPAPLRAAVEALRKERGEGPPGDPIDRNHG